MEMYHNRLCQLFTALNLCAALIPKSYANDVIIDNAKNEIIPIVNTSTGGTPRRMEGITNPWDIGMPDYFQCETAEFLYRYEVSDRIENDMVGMELSRGDDCEIPIDL